MSPLRKTDRKLISYNIYYDVLSYHKRQNALHLNLNCIYLVDTFIQSDVQVLHLESTAEDQGSGVLSSTVL